MATKKEGAERKKRLAVTEMVSNLLPRLQPATAPKRVPNPTLRIRAGTIMAQVFSNFSMTMVRTEVI